MSLASYVKSIWKTWFMVTVLIAALQLSQLAVRDHEADAFRHPHLHNLTARARWSGVDSAIYWALHGYSSWDGQHLVSIACEGYALEKQLVFFPLFPLVVRAVCRLLVQPLVGWVVGPVDPVVSMLLSGVLLNHVLVLANAVLLFLVTVRLFRDSQFAFGCALIFLVNPASIFMHAFYSESLYCFFYLALIFALYSDLAIFGRMAVAASLSFLTSACRSNGFVNTGYIAYLVALHLIRTRNQSLLTIVLKLLAAAMALLVGVLGYVVYARYAMSLACAVPWADVTWDADKPVANYGRSVGWSVLGLDRLSWCDSRPAASLAFYSHLQKKYWAWGAFSYFQLKQIPNFMLACPLFYFACSGLFEYFQSVSKSAREYFSTGRGRGRSLVEYLRRPAFSRQMVFLSFAVHLGLLLCVAVVFLHIQVSTRLVCSSSAMFYWLCAENLSLKELDAAEGPVNNFIRVWRLSPRRGKLFLVYCWSYLVVGTVMFSNFLPWT